MLLLSWIWFGFDFDAGRSLNTDWAIRIRIHLASMTLLKAWLFVSHNRGGGF